MPAYITLIKFTQQGIKEASPERMQRAKAAIEKAGGRNIGTWLTLGEYDVVAINELPDDLTVAASMLSAGREGAITTVTMRAFSEDEFAQIVSKLP